jgi:hypothetical protein
MAFRVVRASFSATQRRMASVAVARSRFQPHTFSKIAWNTRGALRHRRRPRPVRRFNPLLVLSIPARMA